jgi:hypothetical protein
MAYGVARIVCYPAKYLCQLRGLVEIRLLIAFEPEYRAYQGVIAAAIRVLRPHVEVETADLYALEEEIQRLDPEMVICGPSNTADLSDRLVWVRLSMDPSQPTRVSIGGRYSERTNPTLEALLEVIDEAETFISEKQNGPHNALNNR